MSTPADQDRPVVHVIPDPDQNAHGIALRTVHVLRAPVRVWDRAGTHTAELLREFALLTIGSQAGTTRQVPDELLALVGDLRARYAGASSAQAAELEQAVEAGESVHDFTYEVPDGIGQACQTLLELLDAADDYCRQGDRLITLVSPPDQQAFRTWYLGEFVRQSAGLPPRPWDGPTA
ncbi:MAG: hypothetical protein JWN08_2889 [Frankiales bacterium]|nr:hypothetical protein [Frankiales bacterium]